MASEFARLKTLALFVASVWLAGALALPFAGRAGENYRVEKRISIEWKAGAPTGQILVANGALSEIKIVRGKGSVQTADHFACLKDTPCRLDLGVKGTNVEYGKGGTIVTVADKEHPFSFFLRDASRDQPIYIPTYGVVVTTAEDTRSYSEIVDAIRARGLQTKLEQLETEPEESFEAAAPNARELKVPTWLGLGRDIRTFEIDERLETVTPRFHYPVVPLPENQNNPVEYQFLMGRGWGVGDMIESAWTKGPCPS